MIPDSKVHGANMGPTWVLSAPDGPHVGPMNLAIWDIIMIEQPCKVLTFYLIQRLQFDDTLENRSLNI